MATIIGRDTGRQDGEQPGVTDNPSGYLRPNEGYDPDGDGVLNPMRAAQVSQNHEVRESTGSGSFSLDADAMRALRPRWEKVRDKLRDLVEDAEGLKHVTEPARDKASLRQIDAVKKHREVYAAIVKQQYEYAEAYVHALETAINRIEETDRAAGDSARKVSGAIDA